MTTTSRQQSVIRLNHDDDGKVLITPESMDKLVLPTKDAVNACVTQSLQESLHRMIREKFGELCNYVVAWCHAQPKVERALIAKRDEYKYLLLLVVSGSQHECELDESVSDLDLALFDKFPEFPFSVLTVPQGHEGSVAAFVEEDEALLVYAKSSGTQSGG